MNNQNTNITTLGHYNLNPIDLDTTEVSQQEKDRLADLLFEIGAVNFGAFRIKMHETRPDAPLSPLYVNLRLLRSFPPVLAYVSHLLNKIARPLTFDLLADIPSAATPFVSVLSYLSGRPMISPRKETKNYGLGVAIDGQFKSGQRVLLIDDLVAKADSKLEALGTLEKAGLVVEDLLMVVDRQQGGVALLESRGYKLHFATTISEMLERYRVSGVIDEIRYKQVKDYLELG